MPLCSTMQEWLMTSKYWRGLHQTTHSKSSIALTWEKSLVCWLFQENWANVYVSLKHVGVNSFLWTVIPCDWFKTENPLRNDNIKYSELLFDWYVWPPHVMWQCEHWEESVGNLPETSVWKMMSESLGCASPRVTKALPFFTSCEQWDTQHVFHFL